MRYLSRVIFLVLVVFLFRINSSGAASLTQVGTITNGGTFFGLPTSIGDINGDGYDDVAASYYSYGSFAGRVYVYYGGASFDNTNDATFTGEVANDYFGDSLNDPIILEDITNDNKIDLLTTGWNYSTGTGMLYAFYNKQFTSNTSAASADLRIIGNSTDRKYFGYGVGSGDYDGDGDSDIAVSSIPNSDFNTISIFVYQNNNGSYDFNDPWAQTTLSNVRFGAYYNGIKSGDFNGDGYDDILSGDNYFYTGYIGKDVFMLLSNGDGTFSEVDFTTTAGADYFGRSYSHGIGDLNNDGKDDYCGGAYNISTSAGRVFCWYGRETFSSSYNFSTANITLNGSTAYDSYGRAVHIEDLNNDGYPELLVGAYQTTAASGSRHGKFYVYKNSASGLDTTSAWISIIKTSGNTAFGNMIETGDLDADGWKDVAIVQGGGASGGSGASIINMYEISHGNPTIEVSGTASNTDLEGTAISGESGYTIKGVEWSTSSATPGTWTACTSANGAFDESTEEFSCDISSLEEGDRSVYIRSYDQNDVYMPSNLFLNKGFILDKDAPGENGQLIGLSKSSLKEIGSSTINSPSREFKLYFDTRDSTTGVKYIMLAQNEDFKDARWRDYDGDVKLGFDYDGKKNFYIRFKDEAGNVSDTFKQTIKVNTTPDLEITQIGTFVPDFSIYKNYFYTENLVRLIGNSEDTVVITVNGTEISRVTPYSNHWEYTHEFLTGKSNVKIESGEEKIEFTLTIDPSTQAVEIAVNTTEEIKPQIIQPTVEGISTQEVSENITQGKKAFWQTILEWVGIKY
ncbi:MAG TPA: FG-GAP-like repeat-containing protein [Patescibacteria group bacterium]|nr:FG-GAP-like repeat-containing protein [Patescibacteria group bacterium]